MFVSVFYGGESTGIKTVFLLSLTFLFFFFIIKNNKMWDIQRIEISEEV